MNGQDQRKHYSYRNQAIIELFILVNYVHYTAIRLHRL